ncbi:hypothetical protein ACL2XQ_09820 [Sodalis sp. RH14]|uniref:hypothetical protein n=1 Tax=Sodalis sp. RH14 TaxID=3394329 RepID=UPI0039B4A759
MISTERLFDHAPYDSTFKAKVISIGPDYLVLDRTLFYPLSGNQVNDSGRINNIDVTNVLCKDNNVGDYISLESQIWHYMDISSFHINQEVDGIIDIQNRLLTMRLHSASHLVEHFISKLSGFVSVEGSFVNYEKDRTDYKFTTSLTIDDLNNVGEEVNNFIAKHIKIETKISNGIKQWICGDIKMLCCGTHVDNVSKIGKVKLKRKNKGKGIYRVETYLLEENNV